MQADSLSSSFGKLSLAAIPRSSSDLVLSPRAEPDIPIMCVALEQAILSGNVKKALELFEDKRIPKVLQSVSFSTVMLNNYGTELDALPLLIDEKITFKVRGIERTISAADAYVSKKEIFPHAKYAEFADEIRTRMHVIERCQSFAIADGCGLDAAKPAAELAAQLSLDCLTIKKANPRKIAMLQVEALQKVQEELMTRFKLYDEYVKALFKHEEYSKLPENDPKQLEALQKDADQKKVMKYGRTTLTIVTIAEDMLIATWIGDCKVFLRRIDEKGDRQFVDITASSRSNALHAADAGGALGNHGGGPFWGNVRSAVMPLLNDDTLLLCTDGVYDNFDPECLGKKPSDYGFVEDKWVPKNRVMRDFRQTELVRNLEELISDRPIHEIGPLLQRRITDLTHAYRMYLYDNPQKIGPDDRLAYPGKPDHASALILHVQIAKKNGGSIIANRFSQNRSEK